MSLVNIRTGEEIYPGAVLGAWSEWDSNDKTYTRTALVADPRWGLVEQVVARMSRGASRYTNFYRVIVDAEEGALQTLRDDPKWKETRLAWEGPRPVPETI